MEVVDSLVVEVANPEDPGKQKILSTAFTSLSKISTRARHPNWHLHGTSSVASAVARVARKVPSRHVTFAPVVVSASPFDRWAR